MDPVILTLNAGSSSLKFAAYASSRRRANLLASGRSRASARRRKARIRRLRRDDRLAFDRSRGRVDHDAAMGAVLDWLERRATIPGRGGRPPHRAWRPGFVAPVLIDDATLAKLQGAHPARAAAPAAQYRWRRGGDGGVSGAQVACFDTAFIARHPFITTRTPCRAPFTTRACAAMASTASPTNSSSASCARSRRTRGQGRDRRPSRQRRLDVRGPRRPAVASTMGFTALDGLPMGTRCGQLDPGVVLYLWPKRR